jgi:diguanylate cyclase (GGDEF)-like protein/PAS domain S-box-containing protein
VDTSHPRPCPQGKPDTALRAAIESRFEQFDLIARNGAVGVIAVRERRILRASAAAARVFGTQPTALAGQPLAEVFASEDGLRVFLDRAAALLDADEPVSIEWRARRADGGLFWCRFLLIDEGEEGAAPGELVWLVEDVSARKEAELEQEHAQEELEFTMREVRQELMWSNERLVAELYERSEVEERERQGQLQDALTGLPKRGLFERRVHEALRSHSEPGDCAAVLALDFDGFSACNEALGHRLGDELLRQAGRRLAATVRASDLVARSGSDEFAVLLGHLRSAHDVARVARKLAQALAEPYVVDGQEVSLTVSVGTALFPEDGAGAASLLEYAEVALTHAKTRGRGGVLAFEPQMSAAARHRIQTESALRRAIERREFVVHFQPRIDLLSGSVLGAEALLRWQHPDRGLLEPAEFMAVAEASGLIAPIGEIVLAQACAFAASHEELGGVSVNLSPREFRGRGVVAAVQAALAASGLAPRRLAVEITEASFLGDLEAAARALNGLRDLGVRIVLDDFGTGQSSLAYLRRFAVDAIKIEGSIVRAAAENEADAHIVRAIAGLGHGLGLAVIAEGVETEAQCRQALACGCDEAQGYLLGRPQPAEAWAELPTA